MGLVLADDALAKFEILGKELVRWGNRVNLTAVLDEEGIVATHFLDSLSVHAHVTGPQVIDIGTGAGFPGLPLAIADPEKNFVLLDSNGKKISFVRHMIGRLGLDNATAVKARIEDYAPGKGFDTVIVRALAAVPRLIELAAHLVGEDGQLLMLKGKDPAQELAGLKTSSAWNCRVDKITVPGLEAHTRHLVIMQRSKD